MDFEEMAAAYRRALAVSTKIHRAGDAWDHTQLLELAQRLNDKHAVVWDKDCEEAARAISYMLEKHSLLEKQLEDLAVLTKTLHGAIFA